MKHSVKTNVAPSTTHEKLYFRS